MSRILVLMGLLSIFIGLGAVLYSTFALRPKLAELPNQIDRGLEEISEGGAQSSLQILNLLPETLTSIQGTLSQASNLLNATGHTAHKATKGLAGMLAPKDALNQDDSAARKTSDQLRLTSTMIGKLKEASVGVTGAGPDRTGTLFLRVQNQLKDLRKNLEDAALPTHAMLLGWALGGLYILFGIFSFVLGQICKAVQKPAFQRSNKF